MSRRQSLRATPSRGQLNPPGEAMSPLEARRLLDLARCGLRDAHWGSQVGRLHVHGCAALRCQALA